MSTRPKSRRSTNVDRDLDRVQPGRTEPFARGFIEFLGGPFGRFGAPGTARMLTPLRVIIALSLVFLALGWLTKANCIQGTVGDDGMVNLNWSGSRQLISACYSDMIPLYGAEGLKDGHFPYAYSWTEGDGTVRYMEYPVLTGLFQWVMAQITRTIWPAVHAVAGSVPEVAVYFSISATFLALFWVLAVRCVYSMTGNRVWDTVLMAVSPLVVVHAFTNYDTLVIAAALAAMLAVARGRPGVGGMLIGLGIALKLWPLFMFGAYLVLAVRTRRFRPFLVMVASGAGTWLVVNLPIMLAFPEGWREFFRLNTDRGWEWSTIYAIAARNTPWNGWDEPGTEPVILNAISLALFLIGCLAIGVLGVLTRRQPRVAELVFLIVAVFLLTNKVWSPQYSLWLVPLAVLALPRWRLLLAWGLAEAMVWPVLMWHMAGDDAKGAPPELFDTVLVIRGALLITIIVLVVRQMLGRSVDPVLETNGGVDPLAGGFLVRPGATYRGFIGTGARSAESNTGEKRDPALSQEEGAVSSAVGKSRSDRG
ncbi:glycosyltransferase 87 family protein [Corynebacterium sp. CCM 9185]|uniref:DUF2029 domain-containing protein n=1 Tax=Corynebacterium marambiense TaxID=2765364 RepID=A0ABS0VW69_9CORY|nr:glycosyltransferase 87 family protein [Corynebacterium marambiense]MBI8999870.1 DUF2029 domain-containing protein [Corynebacterium marambiense]MCK7662708.1 glycosyltransferase 87 family protein [Corynebacterium marambiense]